MHAYLTLFIHLAILAIHLLIKLRLELCLFLALQGIHMAERVHPAPHRILLQPDCPGNLFLSDWRREQRLFEFRLPFEYKRPFEVTKARGAKVWEGKDAGVECLCPFAAGGP